MSPEKSNRWLIIGGVVAVLAFILVFLFVKPKPKNRIESTEPPSAALEVTKKYIQIRQNAVGADQTSPTSWLNEIKPLTTSTWYSRLQPPANVSTSSTPVDYYTAHKLGFVVKSETSNCSWKAKTEQTATIYCELTDHTTRGVNGEDVAKADIPFGWGHNGPQPPSTLKLVQQSGRWLVDGEVTYSGE